MKFWKKFKSIMPHVTVLTAEDIQQLRDSAENSDLEVIKEILSKKKFRIIPLSSQAIFDFAFSGGNVEIIEYLLTSEHCKELHNTNLNNGFRIACITHNLDIIKNILNSEKIKKNLTINNIESYVLICAARGRNFEVVEYLFCSPQFKGKLDLNTNDDVVFKQIFNFGSKEMLEYLILDLNIPMTYSIHNFLNTNSSLKYKSCRKLFEVRELKNELESAPNANLGKVQKRMKV